MKADFDFRGWILGHTDEEYTVKEESGRLIKLSTDCGEASIEFTDIEGTVICEFLITSHKDGSVKFYLHFELKDEEHAHQLYEEMTQTLIGLKAERTLKVLLSCTSGLTTSMFAGRLNEAAQMLGLDWHFDAVSYLNIYEKTEDCDVVLIAPQIGYMLSRLKSSLSGKLVLQVPTAAFGSYDTMAVIRFLQEELEAFQREEEEEIEPPCPEYEKRILSIAIFKLACKVKIYYRLYDHCEVIESDLVIKPSLCLYDLYDIIDTVLVRQGRVDIIGVATPGIVKSQEMYLEPANFQAYDIEHDFRERYGTDFFIINNANAAAVGFSIEHPEYSNVVYFTQPNNIGGQGSVVNGKVVTGLNGIAGEIRFYLQRMQLSNEIKKLVKNQQGAVEMLTKGLLPTIAVLGPEAVAVYSPMTPDMSEIWAVLSTLIDEDFLPALHYIRDPAPYMLAGITKLCVESLKEMEAQEEAR